jgi:Trk-type K+ transport system membrane component
VVNYATKGASAPSPGPLPVTRTPEELARDAGLAGSVAWAWAILLLASFVVFRSGWMHALVTGNEMSVERAAFAVVNAGTLTGFQQNLAVDQYKPVGQLAMLVLTIGGSLFPLIVGGIAVARIAKLPYSAAQIALASVLAEFAAIIVGGVALLLGGESGLPSIIQASSAFGNSGIWMGTIYAPSDWRVQLILLPLAVLGGLGIPVVLELMGLITRQRPLSQHSRVVLAMTGGVYIVGAAVLVLLQAMAVNSPSFGSLLVAGSVGSINARSAGLPVQFASDFARAGQWILLILMMIGANPGGTGGGLRTTTLAQLFAGTRDLLARRSASRSMGIAVVWTGLFLAIVLGSLLSLLYSEPDRTADYLLFLSVSATANAGLAYDRLSIVGQGMHTLTAAMLLGRAVPLIVLWWMARTTPEADVAVA